MNAPGQSGTNAADRELIGAIRQALADRADPVRAAGQQRYMKSAMPYRGLTVTDLRVTLRPVLAAHRQADRGQWEATARTLWNEAEYREERYACIGMLRHRFYRGWATEVASVPLYRHLIETGAWWDLVDDIASHLLAPVLLAHPETESARMRSWAIDPHLWVRRSAILSQLPAKRRTDRGLLVDCITPNLADREFFIRKAIGWALREFAKTDPQWVRRAVAGWGDALSPLSRREALKHLSALTSTPSAPTRP